MRIAAVIVTYNRLQLLQECIAALKKQTQPLTEIIVINNNSTDGTTEWLATQKELTVINQDNCGSAGGFATGISVAYEHGHDWIWCMDDDAEPYSDALEKCNPYFNDEACVAITNLKVDTNGIPSLEYHGRLNICCLSDSPFIHFSTQELTKDVVETDYAPFVGVILSRKVVKAIGVPDQKLFIYHDDVEYSYRISKCGTVKLITKSIIFHKEVSIGIIKPFFGRRIKRRTFQSFWLQYYAFRNMTYLKKKLCPFVITFLYVLRSLIKNILLIVLFDDNKLRRIRLIIHAYRDGLLEYFDNSKPKKILFG